MPYPVRPRVHWVSPELYRFYVQNQHMILFGFIHFLSWFTGGCRHARQGQNMRGRLRVIFGGRCQDRQKLARPTYALAQPPLKEFYAGYLSIQ